MPNQLNKFIVFTDLADYTLKSSLLTTKQLKEFIIDKQDEIILPLIKEFHGELVKYIGDSYLILFNKINDSVKFSIKLQKKFRDYNKIVNINLKKIELKIVINYGNIFRKTTKIGIDYFGDTLNIASRVLEKTVKNKIFITQTVYDLISDKDNVLFLGDYNFKGLIYKVSLYELIFDKRFKGNSREKLDNDKYINKNIEITKKIDKLIFNVSSVAFIVTIQPIPFFDNYILVLLHLYLLKEIAFIYGINLTNNEIKEIIGFIFISIGGIYTTNQVISGIGKIALPVLGGYLIAPSSFALTFGIGKVFANYFYYRSQDDILTNQDIKDIFLGTKQKGLVIAKNKKNEILVTGKEYKDITIKQVMKLKKLYDDVKYYIKKKK